MTPDTKTAGTTGTPRTTIPESTTGQRRLQLVMSSEESDLTPDEIAQLIELAGSEHQTIADMEACWTRLRASHRAKERLQNLTPSEISAALAVSKQTLGQPLGSAIPKKQEER